jgi:hypothetical protein
MDVYVCEDVEPPNCLQLRCSRFLIIQAPSDTEDPMRTRSSRELDPPEDDMHKSTCKGYGTQQRRKASFSKLTVDENKVILESRLVSSREEGSSSLFGNKCAKIGNLVQIDHLNSYSDSD